MKIAMLCGSGEMGGAERSLLDLAVSLKSGMSGVITTLVVPEAGTLQKEAERAGFPVVVAQYPASVARLGEQDEPESGEPSRSAKTGPLLARVTRSSVGIAEYARILSRALREIDADVVHSHALKMHVFGTMARPSRAALVWHFHEGVGDRPVMRRFVRGWSRFVDASVAVSGAVAADVARSLGGAAPEVVLNAIDLTRFTPDGPTIDLDQLAGMPSVPEATVRVGIVGTMGRFKGQDTFLRAIAQVDRRIALRAYIVGGPVYRTDDSQVSVENLRALASELGIGDRVAFTGFVADVPAVMRSLDVVVHATTRPEPFGLVIAEAMACGRAVIASDGGGAAEVVVPEHSGLTHPRGDDSALATAISRLASDPALRRRLGAAGVLRAREHFDAVRLGAQMLPIYRAAIQRRAGRRS